MYENVESGQLSQEQIDAYLAKPVLARLATAVPATAQPHVVPLWYLWDGEAIWISGFRTTRKFRELIRNRRCSILVDEATSAVDYWAVLFEGEAEIIDEPRELVHEMATRIYTRYLGAEDALDPTPQSWIHDADNLLARLAPQRTWGWYSARK